MYLLNQNSIMASHVQSSANTWQLVGMVITISINLVYVANVALKG